MDQYIVSARKYRPSNFTSVVGQQSLTATLKNAIASDRLAHAYLFCGGRGVGKTSCARIFAKTINCTNRNAQGEACEECDSCRQFNEGRSMNILELDAASHNGVDDIKALIEQVAVPPTVGRYRVFIVDEVHMLTPSAFNAFLKTLEEPPAHAIFILATTEKHKILPTILSRCQIYDFNRIGIADMVSHMQMVAASEGIEAEPEALSVIARKADGAMRDALSIFDQVAAFTRGHITYKATIENLNVLDRGVYNRLLDAMVAQDIPQALLIYKEVRDRGFDSQFFISGLGLYMRDLMVSASPATGALVEAPESERLELSARAAKLHPTFFYRAMELCNEADFNFRGATNKQFLIELTLIRLCQLLSPSSGTDGDDEGQIPPLKAVTPKVATTAGDTSGAPAATAQPRPAASPEPAPLVFTHPPRNPHAQAGGNMRLGTLYIRKQPVEAAPAAQEAAPPAPVRDRQCTPDELLAAWRSLAAKLASEPLIKSVVEAAAPEALSNLRLKITVAASVQAELLNREKGRINTLLAAAVQNDAVDYDVIVDDTNLPPAYWPEQRVLEYMKQKHPVLAEYIQKFKMRVI